MPADCTQLVEVEMLYDYSEEVTRIIELVRRYVREQPPENEERARRLLDEVLWPQRYRKAS